MQATIPLQPLLNQVEGSVLPSAQNLGIHILEKNELLLPIQSRTDLQALLIAQGPPSPSGSGTDLSVYDVEDKRWKIARKRFQAILEFLDDPSLFHNLPAHAAKADVHPSTFYRWLQKYLRGHGLLSTQLDQPRTNVKSKFTKEVEALIQKAIDRYCSSEKPSVAGVWKDLDAKCTLRGLKTPHVNTLRLRISMLPKEDVERARSGKRAAKVKFAQHKKKFPLINGPLALVEIDETPGDLMLVDAETRKPIGRVHITVVLDVYSRMVLGFHISIDKPSAMTAGLALLHAILPKQAWLDEMGVDAEWPCQGIPKTIYTDNALNFRGHLLQLWAEMFGRDLQFRPLRVPETGGHIERIMRTLAGAVHEIPGTTFSNTKERGDYKPAEEACMTPREFEAWMTSWVALYHISPHSGLGGMTPLAKWKDWFRSHQAVGDANAILEIPDPIHLTMSLLPYEERTIQQYGVQMFGEAYNSDVLRRFVHSKDPDDPRRKMKYIVRYDPREVSRVYFWEPDTQNYYPIPWRDLSRKPCSKWELEARNKETMEVGKATVNRLAIAKQHEDLEARKEFSKANTLKQRREIARKKSHREDNVHTKVSKSLPNEAVTLASTKPKTTEALPAPVRWGHLEPFSEIE